MLNMLFVAIVFIIILLAIIIIVRNHPDFWFWIFLNLFFDPGGYVYGFMGGTFMGPLHQSDIFIAGMMVCLISAKVNWKAVFEDKELKRFFIALIIFAMYYYIFYGGVVPFLHNDWNYKTFLMKNRLFAYGFILLLSIYVFAFRGLYYYFLATLVVGFICLNLFFITLVTGINLIPVFTMARNPGEDMMRVGMLSYGIFYSIFPISLITYILSKKINIDIKYKKLLYYTGIVMLITLLLTLTRRIQIDIIGTAILLSIIIAYIFRIGKLSSLMKVIVPAFVVFIVLYITFPDYTGYIAETAEDTFLLMTTGRDSKGQTDQRVSATNDYVEVIKYIENNLVLGAGWTKLEWKGRGNVVSPRGKHHAIIMDAAGEVPIYFLFFGFGLAGAILIIPLYFLIIKLFISMMNLLRKNIIKILHEPLIIIISVYVVLSISVMFTLNFYALGSHFSSPDMTYTAVLLGIGYALNRKLTLYNEINLS